MGRKWPGNLPISQVLHIACSLLMILEYVTPFRLAFLLLHFVLVAPLPLDFGQFATSSPALEPQLAISFIYSFLL
jgi:hypothetical protein